MASSRSIGTRLLRVLIMRLCRHAARAPAASRRANATRGCATSATTSASCGSQPHERHLSLRFAPTTLRRTIHQRTHHARVRFPLFGVTAPHRRLHITSIVTTRDRPMPSLHRKAISKSIQRSESHRRRLNRCRVVQRIGNSVTVKPYDRLRMCRVHYVHRKVEPRMNDAKTNIEKAVGSS